MSNIARFKSGQIPEYLISVNTGDYVIDADVVKNQVQPNDPDVIINPNITIVKNIPMKYWKRVINEIQEMTVTEKQAVEDAIKAKRLEEINNYQFGEGGIVKKLVEMAFVTKQQIIDIVKQMEGLI